MKEAGIDIVIVSGVAKVVWVEGFGPPDPYPGDGGPRDGWVVHASIRVAIGFRRGLGVAWYGLEGEFGGKGEGAF